MICELTHRAFKGKFICQQAIGWPSIILCQNSSMPPLSDGLPDYSFHRFQSTSVSCDTGTPNYENTSTLGYIISLKEFKSCKETKNTLHMMTRYADLSGKLNEILKEIRKQKNHFLKGFAI